MVATSSYKETEKKISSKILTWTPDSAKGPIIHLHFLLPSFTKKIHSFLKSIKKNRSVNPYRVLREDYITTFFFFTLFQQQKICYQINHFCCYYTRFFRSITILLFSQYVCNKQGEKKKVS
jgi:hypothetical protein